MEYSARIAALKKILQKSNLSQINLRKVETLLRDGGADYFKILRNDTVENKYWFATRDYTVGSRNLGLSTRLRDIQGSGPNTKSIVLRRSRASIRQMQTSTEQSQVDR